MTEKRSVSTLFFHNVSACNLETYTTSGGAEIP